MTNPLTIRRVRGADLDRHIPDLARLRITVFRDWPYLYDGDPDYEARYLATYSRAAGSVVVLAEDAGRVVGAATAVPLAAETPEVQAPFIAAGMDPGGVFYLGESVLLPAYRGRGIGVRFLAEREAHAAAIAANRSPGRWAPGSGMPSAACSGRQTTRAGRPRTCPSTTSGPAGATGRSRA